MNRIALASVLAMTLFSIAPAHAQPAASGDKAAQAPSVADFDKQLAKAQENMKKMQEQMDRIQKTQDPKERQKLLQEHWTTMQNGMEMMRGLWGQGMMGGGHMMGGNMMGWQGASGYYSNLTPEQNKQRQYMMDQYMGMQQMMMGHMMMHQGYMWQQPTK